MTMRAAATAVLLGSSVVILVGSVVELRDTLRRRREHLAREEALDRLLDARPLAILSWAGLAALALLGPALWRDSSLPLGDAALVIAILGFAAERASYLVGRADGSGARSPLLLTLVAAAVSIGGVTVGLTA
jgi:hypothetical protein